MHRLRMASQRGFSLVELMVALLIGVILTSGVISVYITSKASYSMNTGLGQVQEAGRYALGIMQPILVMAGNIGCYHPKDDSEKLDTFINSSDPVYNLRHAVYGFEYTDTLTHTGIGDSYPATTANAPIAADATLWSPNLSVSPLMNTAIAPYAVKYSDVLMVHEMLPNPAAITDDDNAPSGNGTLTYSPTNAPTMSTGMLMVASNCGHNDSVSFQATGVTSTTISHAFSGTPGNAAVPPSGIPGQWIDFSLAKGSVGPAQTYVFFVGRGIDGGSSLYEATLKTSGAQAGQVFDTPKEMVPGVENMQVLYGVDTGNSDGSNAQMDFIPNNYETASEIDAGIPSVCASGGGCWDRVVSVRVALLVHSDPNTTDKAPAAATTIHMLGTTSADSFNYTTYVDRRLRRYFVQTFSLRNLLP
jgi:type IV pilus assembly protein PilW